MISIAIPDSLFLEDDTLRDKTVKVGLIARSISIFGVERIYIYRDLAANHEADYEAAKLIFDYAETPQYLRRKLISKRKQLEYVGLLPPLRIPSHLKESRVELNEVREAVVLLQNGELVADIGSKELARLDGRVHQGQRVTVKVTSLNPLSASVTERPKDTYWGFEVRRAPSLSRFLKSATFDLTIMTSRLGRPINETWSNFCLKAQSASRILCCFGSPEAGVDKMLRQDNAEVSEFDCMYVNTFPNQKTETVRLEEAILGFLSILNIALNL